MKGPSETQTLELSHLGQIFDQALEPVGDDSPPGGGLGGGPTIEQKSVRKSCHGPKE